jgi:hypothetical protein
MDGWCCRAVPCAHDEGGSHANACGHTRCATALQPTVFRFPFTSRCVCSEPVRVKSGYSDAHRLGGFVSFRFISISFSFLFFVFVFGFRFHFPIFVFCFRVCVLFSCSLAGWCGLDTHAVMQRLRNMPAPFTRWVLLLLFYLIPVLPHSSSDRQRPAAGRDSEPKKPAGLDASTCPPGNPEGMSALCTLHSHRRERALSVCRS